MVSTVWRAGWRAPSRRPVGRRRVEPWGVSRLVLLGLQVFVGLGAYVGGYRLVTDGFGMSPTLLAGTPFSDWVWPGVALLAWVAVPMTVAAGLELAGSRKAFLASAGAGALLAGWIVVQLSVIGVESVLQLVMLAAGLAMVLLSFAAHPDANG